ncbi:MFS transporter [Pokkaliibacter sp. CJK22405]|uniref:MFS transporter n=1 Tax=Pokkaliibacter sp. CJK22405 TaxID=3384615 RepID=UPI0039847E61
MNLTFNREALPYWRLSGFYACYFAFIGCFSPYWSVYLDGQGFDAIAIGQLMSIYMATRIVGPNLWGWLADKTQQRLRIIRIGAFLGSLCVAGVWISHTMLSMALAMVAFTLFLNAVLPQFEVITLQYLGTQRQYYSKIRIWGSLGFIAMVLLLGWALEITGTAILPFCLMLALGGSWLFSCSIQDPGKSIEKQEGQSFFKRLLVPQVLLFYGIFLLAQLAMGPYYTFYSLYMKAHGYSSAAVGTFWALGVVAEVVLFFFMYRFLKWGVVKLLTVALLLSVIRWTVTAALPDSLLLMALVQLFHAATFGVLHVCGINLVQQYFSGGNEGQGQALFSALAYGAGGSIGAFASGYIWQNIGMSATFYFAAIITAVAFVMAILWMKEPAVTES